MRCSLRTICILLSITALAANGCSDSGSNPTAPSADSRGTPLGAAGTFEPGSRLLWSAASNEIVGTGAVAQLAPPGLVAMHSLLGTSRVLDPSESFSPVAPASGTPVYYEANQPGGMGPDSVALRRVSLPGGEPVRIETAPSLHVFVQMLSADGAWLAWTVGPLLTASPDSIAIQNTASGSRSRIAPGVPELISPDGSRLLYSTRPTGGNPPPLTLHDRNSGTDVPFDLGLPAGAAPAGLRWDAAGIHALYVMAQQQVWVRHVAAAVDEHLYDSTDTLLAFSGSWSPDGSQVAMWGVSQVDTQLPLRLSVHVVDVAAKTGSVVAVGEFDNLFRLPPSGIAFSPDSRTVAYLYFDQLFTSAVPTGPAQMHARQSGTRPATVRAGGRAGLRTP